jgi:hypothetical protein
MRPVVPLGIELNGENIGDSKPEVLILQIL